VNSLSKKKAILGFLVIITLVVTIYGVSVVYSVVNIKYQLGDVSINPTISFTGFPPEYTGYIAISTPLTLKNNGLYTIKNLRISILVTSINWEISNILNGIEVASGDNYIGTISAGETWDSSINVNITNYIPNFAVEDCTLLINVAISLTYQPLIEIPLSFTIEHSEQYLAPF
jgi:hypothetical protein